MKRSLKLTMVACCSLTSIAYINVNAAPTSINGTVAVKLVLTDSCQISGNDPANSAYGTIDFGTHHALHYDELNASLVPSTGSTLEVSCSDPHNIVLKTDSGQYATGQQRRMVNSASAGVFVPYILYQPQPNATTEWAPNTEITLASVASTAVPLTFAAKVPAAPSGSPAGSYSDQLTMTISY